MFYKRNECDALCQYVRNEEKEPPPVTVDTIVCVEFHERLQAVLTTRGWTAYEWAQRASLSDATVTNMISRKAKGARPASLSALATSAGVAFDWLARGVGPSGLDKAPPSPSAVPPSTNTDRPPMSLEDALDRAFDRGVHSLHDALAVRMAFATAPPMHGIADVVAAARAWLDAAAELRRTGRDVTLVALLERVTERMTRNEADSTSSTVTEAEVAPAISATSERPVEGTESMPSESPPLGEEGSGLRTPLQVHRDEHGNLVASGGHLIPRVVSPPAHAKTASSRKSRR